MNILNVAKDVEQLELILTDFKGEEGGGRGSVSLWSLNTLPLLSSIKYRIS